ncbi:hypothetical protein BSKO_01214 [Bryopsis sp. KO-2023]|nr:hypothetical protein BSKO_01214 [Bryopsis sp. KO-2023]
MAEEFDGAVKAPKAPKFQMVDLEPPQNWSKIREKLLAWDSEQILPSHWDCIVAYAKEYEETPNKLQWHQFVVFFFESPSSTLKLDHRWDELKDFMLKEIDICPDWVQFE